MPASLSASQGCQEKNVFVGGRAITMLTVTLRDTPRHAMVQRRRTAPSRESMNADGCTTFCFTDNRNDGYNSNADGVDRLWKGDDLV
jgi:hypothetical protein